MSREELMKRAGSIISKQARIWGTWGTVFAAQLCPDTAYVSPLISMALGPLFEGDNLAKFIIEIGTKANKAEGQVVEPPKEWNCFVKSTLIGIKDAKYEEQISIVSDIFIDAYTGKIEACTDAELYIEVVLEMSRSEIEFMGCLYKYFAGLENSNPSLSIVDFDKVSYLDKDMIHPLLNRLVAKGIVVNSTIFVDEDGSNSEDISISVNEDTFYPTALGYVIVDYLVRTEI